MQKHILIEQITPYFLKNGYRSFTIDDFSREVKISKKTIYELFRGKKDIIDQVLKYRNKETLTNFYRIRETHDNAIDEIIVFFKRLFQFNPVDVQKRNAYELKKYYKSIYESNLSDLVNCLNEISTTNYNRGIDEGFYVDSFNSDFIGNILAHYYIQKHLGEAKVETRTSIPQSVNNFCRLYIRALTTEKGLIYFNESKEKIPFYNYQENKF